MSARARAAAAEVLERVVEEGAYSQRALASTLDRHAFEPRDRGWITRAVYGTLTRLDLVDLALDRLLDRGIQSLRPRHRAHLRIATWEIGLSEARSEAGPLVSAAVEGVKRDGMPRGAGLTNAVLRNLLRDAANVFQPPKKTDDIARFGLAHGLPRWIAEGVVARWGDDAAAAAEGFAAATPVAFRVRSGDRDDVVAELAAKGLDVAPHAVAPDAGVCTRGNLADTAAHAEGRIVIQDAGAQLAVAALPSRIDGAVLDATAGVGGKTLALADRYGADAVVATDVHSGKLAHLGRLPGAAGVEAAPWKVGTQDPPAAVARRAPLAAVLLDAPCSALGTLGRHPEVRWNREPDSVASLADAQAAMLDAVAPLVAPGGVLLYVVCTWTPEETVEQVGRFVERHPEFSVSPPTADSADARVDWSALVDDLGGVSLWPHTTHTDGFYFARLRREE